MDPNTQPPAPNNYDYLYATPAPKQTFMGGGSPKNKMLLSVAFVGIVLLVLIISFSVFRSLTKKDYSVYTKLVDQQTEIVRIVDSGLSKARSTSVKNYVATIRASTYTEKNDTIAYLKKSGVKIDDKKLSSKKDAVNDKVLTDAGATSEYDEKYIALVNTLIIDYQKTVATSVKSATSSAEKVLVSSLQANAQVIANVKK